MKGTFAAAAVVAAALITAGSVSLHTDRPTTGPAPHAERVIVDVDHAIDDVFALALALRSPELEIVGISIAPHPEAALQARFVARLLRELGRQSIPIAIGTSLLTNSCRCGGWQPISHQLGVDWPAPIEEPAAQFIARQANATPGEVSILTFGPLSNLADALRQDPGIADKISRLVMMGTAGLRADGHCREYNVSADPEAARLVFESGIPILAVGVDVTGWLRFSREDIEAALSSQDGFSQVLRIYWQASGATGFCPHDLTATAAAVRESMFAWKQGDGSIASDGCLSFAASADGRLGVATAADSGRLSSFAVERLRSSQTAGGPQASAPAQSYEAVPRRVPEKVIFDLQWFADDLLALAVALRSPEMDIVGVTLVEHCDVLREARVVAALLNSAGRGDIPLAVGRTNPYRHWQKSPCPYPGIVETDGLEPATVTGSAAEFIVQTVNSSPGEITVISVGALSNLGDALRADPSIARKLRRWVLMGGSIEKGYQFRDEPSREHNVCADVESSRSLFHAGLRTLMVGLDATANLRVSPSMIKTIGEVPSPLNRFLHQHYERLASGGFVPFDVMAVAMAVDRSFCEVRSGHVEISDDGYTRLVEGAPPNVEYCVNPDVEAFYEFLLTRLGVDVVKQAKAGRK